MCGQLIVMPSYTAQVVGPINIGNPTEFTIKELAEVVVELTGSKSKIIFLARRALRLRGGRCRGVPMCLLPCLLECCKTEMPTGLLATARMTYPLGWRWG